MMNCTPLLTNACIGNVFPMGCCGLYKKAKCVIIFNNIYLEGDTNLILLHMMVLVGKKVN